MEKLIFIQHLTRVGRVTADWCWRWSRLLDRCCSNDRIWTFLHISFISWRTVYCHISLVKSLLSLCGRCLNNQIIQIRSEGGYNVVETVLEKCWFNFMVIFVVLLSCIVLHETVSSKGSGQVYGAGCGSSVQQWRLPGTKRCEGSMRRSRLATEAQIRACALTTGQPFDLIAEKYHLRQTALSMQARRELYYLWPRLVACRSVSRCPGHPKAQKAWTANLFYHAN